MGPLDMSTLLTSVHMSAKVCELFNPRSRLTAADLRQCLIYDSSNENARLIGVEYMIPKHVYETLDIEEQKLWHSHEFEVSSGMLIHPKPAGHDYDEWEKVELAAMQEVMGLYGKTWHFWQVDRGDTLPLGMAILTWWLFLADDE